MKHLICLVLTGCGAPITTVSPELMPYVASSCVATRNTSDILFSDLGGRAQGVCTSVRLDTLGNKTVASAKIHIDRTIWAGLGECGRKLLITHELLHCERDLLDLYEPTDRSDWMFHQAVSEAECQLFYERNERKYCK